MKLKLLAIFFIALLQSCGNTDGVLTDSEINNNLRQTIKTKNDSLMQALIHSDIKALKQLGSPDFIKYMHSKVGNNITIWAFRRGALDLGSNTILHEYHIKQDKAPGSIAIEAIDEGYTFNFMNKEKESYVCMMKSKYNKTDDYLITTIYGMVGDKWKLNDIKVGLYGVYDKNAKDYFTMAEKAKENDHIIDAFMYYNAAENLQSPLGDMIKYEISEDAKKYTKHMRTKVAMKYKFPQKLSNIETQPIVENIAPSKNAKGLHPIITYRTFVAVEDTTGLKKEYEQVKAEVRKIYKGLNFDRDFMYYRAYNKYSENVHLFEDHKVN